MWQLRSCEQGCILSPDPEFSVDKTIERTILSDESLKSILKKAGRKNLLPMLLFFWSQITVCKCEECYTMDVWYVRCYSRVKKCVCVYQWEKAVSRSLWWICFSGKQGAASSMPSVNSHSPRVVRVCGWWYWEVLRNGGTEEREAWQMNKSYVQGWYLMATVGKAKFGV